ncbi:GspH/FimT family pseudopilin [Halomonas icarae]|uniref:Type II secretion system protein H n=1 Tax=Halomonas icarae TaxID=2691040 RepID=A0A7X4W1L4_9GAMM|nr:GspH/FimT family pseudopilin [Halomonas icarae]MDR5903575.1 GspH/FimT family pseudopilin [Halomonas icarae]NAW14030.1 prepilin-type N-terminal cleavage/methylation domain-containing protein [Halomonas icarae]
MAQRGFTLIELLITMAVAIILMTVAVPGYRNMVADQQMASEYNEILTGLRFARSEAIKRREPVSFELAQGWSYQVKDDEGNLLRQRAGGSGKLTVEEVNEEDLVITFNATGRIDDDSDDCSAGCITLAHDAGSVASKKIAVSRFGRVGKPLPVEES